MPEQLEDIVLENVYVDGFAYFRDSHGAMLVYTPQSGHIEQMAPGDYPAWVNHGGGSYLAERKRSFGNECDAIEYVSATTTFDKILGLVPVAVGQASEQMRSSARKLIAMYQAKLRTQYLHTLATIPAFASVADYLSMTPEEIYVREFGGGRLGAYR